MPDGVAVFGAITGGAGLLLSLVNTWHGLRAEPRKHQYALRTELSAFLNEAERELSELEQAVRFGGDIPDMGPAFNDFTNQLKPLGRELDRSFSFKLSSLSTGISGVSLWWQQLMRIQKVSQVTKSDLAKEWNAAVASLREGIKPAQKAIADAQRKVTQHNKNSLLRFTPYF